PRSVIRGALRRDLRHVIGDGCNMELGGRMCECGVCRIMRHVVVEDARSSFKSPPEIRHRIRLNPHAGVVEEGALFDMETGFQGMVFPFRLYFQTKEKYLAPHLWKVLDHWQNELAVFGGDVGTGLGRFGLENINVNRWPLAKLKYHLAYLINRGFKGLNIDKIKEIEPAPVSRKWKRASVDIAIPPFDLPWEKITYSMNIESPLISRDPISAMLQKENPDAVMVRKTVLEYGDDPEKQPEEKKRFFIKGESVRGVMRSILITNDKGNLYDLDHEDCDCMQCRLFGGVHGQGALRFEDAEVEESAREMKADHVAIDRFTGGGVDRLKFDDHPLAGSRKKNLALNGAIWTNRVLEKDEREALTAILASFKAGQTPVGGLGAIGYGRVCKFMLTEKPEWLVLPENPAPKEIPLGGRITVEPGVEKKFD
ncbi:MAG: hypothetical protein GY859_03300, partial [Desulfobacterales bacterium]|nr:hypothetical protein [Desulfobacterales bacterium]